MLSFAGPLRLVAAALLAFAAASLAVSASASAHRFFLCTRAKTTGAGGFEQATCNAASLKEGGFYSRAYLVDDPMSGFPTWYTCEKVGGSNYLSDKCNTTGAGGEWAKTLWMVANIISGPGKSKLVAEGLGSTECSEDKFSGEPDEEGKVKGEIVFHSCKLVGQPNCEVEESGSFSDQLIEVEEAIEDEFKGAKEEIFITVVIKAKEGKTCLAKGTYHIKGTQKCELPEGTSGMEVHEISCKPSGSSLKLGESKVTFEDTEKITFEKEMDWGVE